VETWKKKKKEQKCNIAVVLFAALDSGSGPPPVLQLLLVSVATPQHQRKVVPVDNEGGNPHPPKLDNLWLIHAVGGCNVDARLGVIKEIILS